MLPTTFNNPSPNAMHADLVRGGWDTWLAPEGDGTVPADANGWPVADFKFMCGNSFVVGLSTDPLMVGTVSFSFVGKATVAASGNFRGAAYTYNPVTNTTRGTCEGWQGGANASYLTFTDTTRTGVAGGAAGVTNLQVMKPLSPGATESYPFGTRFDASLVATYSALPYTRHRFQRIGNNEVKWGDRTPWEWPNQKGGKRTAAPHQFPGAATTANGMSWDFIGRWANETGKDLHLSVPPLADDDYIAQLVKLLLGKLSKNQSVLLEMGNEMWNYAPPFYQDATNAQWQANAEVANKTPLGKLLVADGTTNAYALKCRWVIARLIQWSEIVRGIVPADQFGTRWQVAYFWQAGTDGNGGDTGSYPLAWAQAAFTRADPATAILPPRPVSDYLHVGGCGCYYTATDPTGTVDEIFASGVPSPALAPVLQGMVKVATEYGLEPACYEGGWGVGGDTATAVQTAAKFDPRAAAAQAAAGATARAAGVKCVAVGTYEQWAGWYDAQARAGLGAPDSYPLVRGAAAG